MGTGSDCFNTKVREYDNKKREEGQNFEDEPFYSNKKSNDEDNIPFRKIIYGQNRANNKLMYDAIFKCESINKLYHDEWTYILYNRFLERIQIKDEEKRKFCTICLIGETNKGKTFLLNLLTDNELQSGIEYRTIGISCKFTNFEFEKNKIDSDAQKEPKFLIFDSAGRSEPLLIEPEKKSKFSDEELKNRVEADNKDLKLSEDFIKNFLISHSRIILVVVNQLTLAEQIFLYELKNDNEDKFEELFIIHNLFNFESKRDIENYINNTIVHSIYFDLSKDYFETNETDNINEVDKPFYFTEEQKNTKGNQYLIAHLFLGNIDSKDEWIKKNNKKTIEFLKIKMQLCLAKDYMSIEKTLEKELILHNLIDERTKLERVEKNDDLGYQGRFRLKKDRDIRDNRSNNFVENREFNILGYTPNYIFYKDEKKSKFVVEVECPGEEDKNMSISAKTKKGKVYFSIRGKKIFPRIIKQQLHKEDKPYSIFFSVNVEKEGINIISDGNTKYDKFENGIYQKIFPIIKNGQSSEYTFHKENKNDNCMII